MAWRESTEVSGNESDKGSQVGSALRGLKRVRNQNETALRKLAALGDVLGETKTMDVLREITQRNQGLAEGLLRSQELLASRMGLSGPAFKNMAAVNAEWAAVATSFQDKLRAGLSIHNRFAQQLADVSGAFRTPQLIKINRMAEQIQRFSLLSESMVARMDWDAIGRTWAAYDALLVPIRTAFEEFSCSYDTLLQHIAPEDFAVCIPELVSSAVVDYHSTVETIDILAPLQLEEELQEARSESLQEQSREVLGKLEGLLAEVNPALLRSWRGVEEALEQRHSDHERHAAVSMREILTHVLHECAPDDEIRRWSRDASFYAKGKPTRRARFRYICRDLEYNEGFADFYEKDEKSFLSIINLLEGGTHGMPSRFSTSDLYIMRIKVESMLVLLLQMAKLSRECEN